MQAVSATHERKGKRGRSPWAFWHRFSKRLQITIVTVIALLLLARLAMPYAIKAYVNRQLSKSLGYAGRIGDIDVHLWRGAYQIQDIKILKTNVDVPVPLFAARRVDLSLDWKEIFHGALVGEIDIDKPEINIVAGPTTEETQTGKEGDWVQTVKSLFPLKINRLRVAEGQIHFQNFHSVPPVDIFLTNVFGIATNLTNSRDLSQPLPTGITARATALDEGDLDAELHMDPLADTPTYQVSAQLTNVNLVNLNDFLKAYGKFDVERGKFALYTSFAAADGKYDGYAKVFFDDLDVFAWEKERKKNALEVFWQAIVGGVSTVFRNQPKNRLATKIPFSGSYDGTHVGVLPAVGTLLRNAFISALVPKLDKTITVEEVQLKEAKDEPPPPSP